MNTKTLIKRAYVSNIIVNQLKDRQMKKQAGVMMDVRKATPEEDEIARLKKLRDRSLVWDLIRHVGYRGLQGAGIGGLGFGALGGALGYAGDPNPAAGATIGALGFGGLGAMGGWHTGGTLGALESLFTYNARKQEAKEKLKKLGVED